MAGDYQNGTRAACARGPWERRGLAGLYGNRRFEELRGCRLVPASSRARRSTEDKSRLRIFWEPGTDDQGRSTRGTRINISCRCERLYTVWHSAGGNHDIQLPVALLFGPHVLRILSTGCEGDGYSVPLTNASCHSCRRACCAPAFASPCTFRRIRTVQQ